MNDLMYTLPWLPRIQFTTTPELQTIDYRGAAPAETEVQLVVDRRIMTAGWIQNVNVPDHEGIRISWKDNTPVRYGAEDVDYVKISDACLPSPPQRGALLPFKADPELDRTGWRRNRVFTVRLRKDAGEDVSSTVLVAHCGVANWSENHVLAQERSWHGVWVPWRWTAEFVMGEDIVEARARVKIRDACLITNATTPTAVTINDDVRVNVYSANDRDSGGLTGQVPLHPYMFTGIQTFINVPQWAGGYWVARNTDLFCDMTRIDGRDPRTYRITFSGWTRGDL